MLRVTKRPHRSHLHADPAKRVEQLIRRGQDQGVFRADLPIDWLVSVTQHMLHGAAEDVRTGRLPRRDAARAVVATVQAILAAPLTRFAATLTTLGLGDPRRSVTMTAAVSVVFSCHKCHKHHIRRPLQYGLS